VHAVGWEHTVMEWVRVPRGSRAAEVASLITELGSAAAVGGVAVGLCAGLFAGRRFRTAVRAAAAMLAGAAGAELMKRVLERRIGAHGGLAYPSGHTAGAAAAATTLALVVLPIIPWRLARRAGAAAVVAVATAVGLGMVAQGSHFPADVLGGIAFGALIPLLVLGGTVRDTPAPPAAAVHTAETQAEEIVEERQGREVVSPARRFGLRDEPVPDEVAAGETAVASQPVAVDAGDGRAP
jgi:hypothetical protein